MYSEQQLVSLALTHRPYSAVQVVVVPVAKEVVVPTAVLVVVIGSAVVVV